MVGYFAYNQTYISQTFCVNQNKPELHCNGTCYLSKLLQKTQQPEVPQELQELQEPVFVVAAFQSVLLVINSSSTHLIPETTTQPQSGFQHDIYQPPSC